MYYQLKNFDVNYLSISSRALKNNPLGDDSNRINPVLTPKGHEQALPVVYVLAGFSGNSPFYLNKKFGAPGFVDVLDEAFERGEAPAAVYVLVDAITSLGGSQFINSAGCGDYEDYIVGELVPAVNAANNVRADHNAVIGGSSGGYGALHLSSSYPDIFPWMAAIAPDSLFEISLLPEVIKSAEKIERLGGFLGVKSMIASGKLFERRDWHDILNVVGMAYCYSRIENMQPIWPIDVSTAEINEEWNSWLQLDPMQFLETRKESVARLKGIFLEVGNRDQFLLHFGARRINRLLGDQGIDHHYREFEGNHFDIGSRRIEIWKWLQKQWSYQDIA